METQIEQLKRELARLGVGMTHAQPEGISVYLDPDLPDGWVRVSDGTGEVYGDAGAIAATLSSVPATGEVRDDGSDVDWEAAWEALGEFSARRPG